MALLDTLEAQFSKKSEILLHDLTVDYSHTIADIRNGYLTGHSMDGSGTNFGL